MGVLTWIHRDCVRLELIQAYEDQAGKQHDRYQGLLDQYITLKGELAEMTRQRDELVTQLSGQNLGNGRLEASRKMQDEALTEVLSFLKALEFNKLKGAAALRGQRDALLDKVRKQG